MYTNWNNPPVYDYLWYSVPEVIRYLRQVKSSILENVTYNNIRVIPPLKGTSSPATKTTRFPDDGLYFCEGTGNWVHQLDILNLAIQSIANPHRLDRMYLDFQTVGQAEIYVVRAINKFMCDLSKENASIVTQETFEKQYNINWVNQSSTIARTDNNKKPQD